MAIVANPFIGRASGKIGNVVLYTHWEQNILRSRPINMKIPRTPRQETQRKRYKKLGSLYHQVLRNINEAYAGSVKDMPAISHVMSINTKNCFVGDTDSIDPSLFILCDNDGSFVSNVVLSSDVANTITGTFDSNAQNADEDADPVKAYGFDVDGNKIWQFCDVAVRSTGTITLTKPETSGLTIAVYFECLDRVNLLMDKPRHVIKFVGMVKVV